jgi:hypothetical protein
MEHGMGDERDAPKRSLTSFEIPEDLRAWLDRKIVERIEAGLPRDERSMGAVIRDLLNEAREREAVAA